MEKIIYICLLLLAGPIWAQETPKNISEESTIKIIKTNNGEEIVEKKIKVTTRAEQHIEFAEQDENKRDKTIVDSPVKISRTVEVGTNNAYDSKTEIEYFEFAGEQYRFKKVDTGFLISLSSGEGSKGRLIKLQKENHYLYQNGSNVGVGYFNDNGNFTIEIYDENTKNLKSQDFVVIQE